MTTDTIIRANTRVCDLWPDWKPYVDLEVRDLGWGTGYSWVLGKTKDFDPFPGYQFSDGEHKRGMLRVAVDLWHPDKRAVEDAPDPDASLAEPCSTRCLLVPKPNEPGLAVWTLGEVDPLTINPAIGCLRCGNRGFVDFGYWRPA